MIGEIRRKIAAELVAAESIWPVYTCKPDDLVEVPSIVVDRPTVTVDVQHHTFSTPVVVIGRRDGTEDAQSELDEVASWAARAIASPELAIARIDPSTASVAELTYPAYTVTVSCGATYCLPGGSS